MTFGAHVYERITMSVYVKHEKKWENEIDIAT